MIRVEAVRRYYGSRAAVDGISFEVRRGEIVGCLGPNGAGKSTLLKMLCTYLPPSAGKIEIAGHDVVREPLAVRARIGYLAEHNPLFESMRVDRFLAFVARVRGLSRARARERIAWTVDRCDLARVLAMPIRECSKGNRQRVGLAAAILHDPPVLLLDEPTHGLDPLQVVAFRSLVRELAPSGAVLLSSHILAEVVEQADRVLALHHGRLVLDLRVDALRERARSAARTVEDLVLEAVRDSAPTATLGARP